MARQASHSSWCTRLISILLCFSGSSRNSGSQPDKGPTAVTAYVVIHMFCAAVYLTHLHRIQSQRDMPIVFFGVFLLLFSNVLYWNLINSDPGYLDPRRGTAMGGQMEEGDCEEEEVEEDVARLVEEGCRVMKNVPRHSCHRCSSGGKPFVQPLRSKHCSDCGQCVRKFDHHCFWIGNCVGEGNHRLFVSFLVCEASLLLFGITQLPYGFIGADFLGNWLMGNGLLALGFAISLTFFLLVVGLVGYHSFLIVTDQTSWEHLGSRVTYLEDLPDGVLPFSRGALTNCFRFWCARRPPFLRPVMLLPRVDENGDYETTCWADCC